MTEYARFEGRGKCGMTGKKSHRKSKVQGWRWLFTLRLRISRHDGSSCCGQECPRCELERADRENGAVPVQAGSHRVAPKNQSGSKWIKVEGSKISGRARTLASVNARTSLSKFK